MPFASGLVIRRLPDKFPLPAIGGATGIIACVSGQSKLTIAGQGAPDWPLRRNFRRGFAGPAPIGQGNSCKPADAESIKAGVRATSHAVVQ